MRGSGPSVGRKGDKAVNVRNVGVIESPGCVPVKTWTNGVVVEDKALSQVMNVARLPFIYKWVAVMPDVHWGIGCTVGSVIPTVGAIVPAAIGVDLGCGVSAALTSLKASDLPDDLASVRSAIEAAVPHGRTDNGGANDRGAWGDIPDVVAEAWCSLAVRLAPMVDKRPSLATPRALHQLGTLGTGNHFIEVCLDEADRVWVTLHSGSRGQGNRIGSQFISIARKDMERWFVHLPDADLAYLPEGTDHFDEYLAAVEWAQEYAAENRRLILNATLQAMYSAPPTTMLHGGKTALPHFTTETAVIDCHHNYVAREHHYGRQVLVTRKGAVRAREGDLGLIPGSMGARSYIVRGKGNLESFCSCSHGAGRAMSRTEARKRISLADHAAATAGVECRKDEDVLDESPAAYKPIENVMAAQSDLVDIVHELHAVVCVKG